MTSVTPSERNSILKQSGLSRCAQPLSAKITPMKSVLLWAKKSALTTTRPGRKINNIS